MWSLRCLFLVPSSNAQCKWTKAMVLMSISKREMKEKRGKNGIYRKHLSLVKSHTRPFFFYRRQLESFRRVYRRVASKTVRVFTQILWRFNERKGDENEIIKKPPWWWNLIPDLSFYQRLLDSFRKVYRRVAFATARVYKQTWGRLMERKHVKNGIFKNTFWW